MSGKERVRAWTNISLWVSGWNGVGYFLAILVTGGSFGLAVKVGLGMFLVLLLVCGLFTPIAVKYGV